MSRHEVTIGDASVTFEQVEVELDYNDILLNIEDTISERITDQINDEAWDAVSVQVEDCVSEHHDTSSEDAVSDGVHSVLVGYRLAPPDEQGPVDMAFEKAVWKAVCRLDNPNTHDSVWAAAAKEYLLSVAPRSRDVRTIVREEMAAVLLAFAEAVNERLGAEITVAPGD